MITGFVNFPPFGNREFRLTPICIPGFGSEGTKRDPAAEAAVPRACWDG